MLNDKFNILIVDDDQQIIDLIIMFLTMNYSDSVNLVHASDSQMALLKLSNQDFDLIILDYRMPGKSGIDLATHLKKSIKYGKIPIILMSGAILQQDAISAIEIGIKNILIKPFSMKQLMAKITLYLKIIKKDP